MGRRPNTSHFHAVKKALADTAAELNEFASRLHELEMDEAADIAAEGAVNAMNTQSDLIKMLGHEELPEPEEVNKAHEEGSGA